MQQPVSWLPPERHRLDGLAAFIRARGRGDLPRIVNSLLCFICLANPLAQAQEPTGIGAAQFAGELMRRHSYLISAQQRPQFDEVNRQLREAKQLTRQANDATENKRAAAARSDSVQRLVKLLAAHVQLVEVKIVKDHVAIKPAAACGLPGDRGAAILQIDATIEGATGDAPVRFTTYDLDQSQRSGKIDIQCAAGGITWVLVGLRNVPAKRTSLQFELDRPDAPSLKFLLDVTTPESGHLKVAIHSADTHEPAPAMVRLVWMTSGEDRKPTTAVDLASLFDQQGSAESRRRPNLPGRLGEHFWCVAKPFRMTLPPGEYQITISRGVEHIPIVDTFVVESGKTLEKSYEPQRWVDMRQLGWYSGDDHVHGQILSDEDAEKLMTWVQAADIHVANIVKMGDMYRTWFEQRGFGPKYRVLEDDWVLSPGQECPRTHDEIGHTLAMNTTAMVRDTDKYFQYDWVADQVHAQGGLWGYAHINSGLFHVHRDMSMNIPRGNVDFAEVLQFQHLGTDLYYDFLNTGFKVTASAGSDVPWGGNVGEVRMYAYLGQRAFSADAWFAAVKRGQTFVTSGPMLQFSVDDALPGEEIVIDQQRKLRVRARAWGHPNRLVPTKLEIVLHGDVLRSVESNDSQQAELAVELEQTAGNGFWIAARATADDGTSAHTTPIYVVRKGMRFWKYQQLDSLLAERRQSLQEVEQLVANAKRKLTSGESQGDRHTQQLAKQEAALLERVAEAQAFYANLEEVAAAEATMRRQAR